MSRGGVGNGNAVVAPRGVAGIPAGEEVREYTLESLKLSEPNDDSVLRSEWEEGVGEEDKGVDARLSVTQSDDPLSGGHFAVGMSKAPLLQVRIHGHMDIQS